MNNHNDDLEIAAIEDEENIHPGVDDLRLPQDLQSMLENSRAVAGTDLVLATPRTDYIILSNYLVKLSCQITVDHSQSCTCVYSCSARMDKMICLPLQT